MAIRTLIVDDEPLARDRLRRFLAAEPEIEIAGEAGDGCEAVAAIRQLQPDLLFLDIQMPERDGFDVLRELDPDEMPVIIFVTAYDQYAVRAFDAQALDYLLKPFNRERFAQALARAKAQLRQETSDELRQRLFSLLEQLESERQYLERIVVKTTGRVFFLRTVEIDWIEAAGNYVRLHVGREAHLVRETMSRLEAQLDPRKFLRIHRSTLVNIERIKELQPMFSGDYNVVLQNGTELTLSRTYRDSFMGIFDKSS